MARLRGVDPVMAALALVVAATLCHGLMWMAMLPPWQGPDEFSHYAYVERVVAQHSLPPIDARSPNPGGGSPSMDEGMRATGFLPLRFRAPVRPLGPNLDKHGPFPAETPNLPQISAGNLGASSYPPLYYALAVPLFAVPRLDTATARLTAMRLLSVIAGALVVVMTFRLARLLEVPAQTAVLAAALVSLFPIMGEAGAIVNPDILLVALLTFFIEMCVRACREPTRRSIVAVGVTAALVALTKPIGAPAAVAVALPIVGICAGSFSPTRRALALLVAAPLCGVAAAAFGRIVISADPTNGRGFLAAAKFGLSDIWQFYLPRLWFMQEHRPLNIPAGIPAGWIWLRGGIGQFGWQFLTMPAWVYHLGGVSLLVLACAAAVGSPRTPNARVPVAVLAGAALYILLLHLSTLDTMLRTNTTILQGRYLLPILPAMIAALFSLTGGLGRRFGLLLGCFLVAARMVFAWQADLTVIEFYG